MASFVPPPPPPPPPLPPSCSSPCLVPSKPTSPAATLANVSEMASSSATHASASNRQPHTHSQDRDHRGKPAPPSIPLRSSSLKQITFSMPTCFEETIDGEENPPSVSTQSPADVVLDSHSLPATVQEEESPHILNSDPPFGSIDSSAEEISSLNASSQPSVDDNVHPESSHSPASSYNTTLPAPQISTSNHVTVSDGETSCEGQPCQDGRSMSHPIQTAVSQTDHDDENAQVWLSRIVTKSTSTRNFQDEQELQRIQEGIEKLKRARIQKELLKVYTVDGSYKMVTITEGMTAQDLCFHLADRFNQTPGPNWTIVEKLNSLHLERTLEDHEKVLRAIWHWPRFSEDERIVFKNNPEKYYLTKRPQTFMPDNHHYSVHNPDTEDIPEETKQEMLIRELFEEERLSVMKGEVYVKEGRKWSWKKHYAVLKKTGLHFSKNDKIECTEEVLEWKCVECYTGNGYEKVYKSPTPYTFSLVPNGSLNDVEGRILHICVSSKRSLQCWLASIRLVKNGMQLYKNYREVTMRSSELMPSEEESKEISQRFSTRKRKPSVLVDAFASAWKNAHLIFLNEANATKFADTRIRQRSGTQLFSVDSGMFSLKSKYYS